MSTAYLPADHVQWIILPVEPGFAYRVELLVANVSTDDYANPPNYPGTPGNMVTLRNAEDWTNHVQRWMGDVHEAKLSLVVAPSSVDGFSAVHLALGSMFIPGGSGHQSPGAEDRWDRSPSIYFHSVMVYRIDDNYVPPILPPPDPVPGLPITDFTPLVGVQGRTITGITVPNFPPARISHYMLLVSNRYGPEPEIITRSWNRVVPPATLVAPPSNIPGNHYLDGWFQLYVVDIAGNGSKPIIHHF